MEPGNEMIVPGDLESFCNVITSMWSVEGNIFVTIEVELQLKTEVE